MPRPLRILYAPVECDNCNSQLGLQRVTVVNDDTGEIDRLILCQRCNDLHRKGIVRINESRS